MREILFKAKREDNNEWVEGYYWTNLMNNHFIRIAKDKNERFTIEDFEVIPETLCQYTGMKDKNGNKIWENDIVVYDNGLARIEWNVSCKAFLIIIFYMGYGVEKILGKIKECDLEVIGNKFDMEVEE